MAVFVADEQADQPVDVGRVSRLAGFVLEDQRVPDAMELSVLCVDRAAIAALNAHHMEAEGPTDVLAFPIDLPGEPTAGEPLLLGDVVLCPAVAAEQAAAQGRAPRDEVDVLVVHGILHLLGHDHAEADDRDRMFGLTDRLLAAFADHERGPDEAAP